MTADLVDDTDTYVPPPSALAAKEQHLRGRAFKIGVCAGVGVLALAALIWQRTNISTAVTSGDTITAEFADSYKLQPHDSTVKEAGLEVGLVTKIAYTDHGTALVTMKIDHDALTALGSHPTARIEPRTVLGGRYVVELHPGGTGTFDGSIPLASTAEPVELDRVLEALPSSSRKALQGLVGEAGPTLSNSKRPLSELTKVAPTVLRPAAGVVRAVQGDHPDSDLSDLVSNLSAAADALTRRDGQLSTIMGDLHKTAVVLDEHRTALSSTVATLPQTVHSARLGITGLDSSVTKLESTARALRPAVPSVNSLVTQLGPVLDQAQPLMRDLRPLLREARPTVRRLVPVARQATSVLGDLHGPVLDRVNGPVATFLLNPWHGTGAYAGATDNYMRDHKVYQELAYMATNIDRASMMQDQHGSTLAFQVGAAANSLDGLPFDLDSLVQLGLRNLYGIKDPAQQKAIIKKAGLK